MALDPEPGADVGAPLSGLPADPGDPAAEPVELVGQADDAGELAPPAAELAEPSAVVVSDASLTAAPDASAPDPGDVSAPPAAEAAPPAPAPVLVEPGRVYAYSRHDDYASPPRVRHQLILAVRVDGDGAVAGVPVGYADELAEFPAGELGPVDGLDG